MNEELINYTTAVLANEKGFPQKETIEGYSFITGYESFDYPLDLMNGVGVAAPTQSLLQKWLREVHNIVVSVDVDEEGRFFISLPDAIYGSFDLWESALEHALVEGMGLIK